MSSKWIVATTDIKDTQHLDLIEIFDSGNAVVRGTLDYTVAGQIARLLNEAEGKE